MGNLTHIPLKNVFISWTGKDADLKDKIVNYLEKNRVSCLVSDHCAGNFKEWSEEAVSNATVFLVIYTPNTVNSEFVPIELNALKKLDDYTNRCVPVVSDMALYQEKLSDLSKETSAVFLDNGELTEGVLAEILENVKSLLINQHFYSFNQNTSREGIKLLSMLKSVRLANNPDAKVYINRRVIDEEGKQITDANVFTKADRVFYLHGPAGSGKSSYINQIRNSVGTDKLVIALNCQRIARERRANEQSVVFTEAYEYFKNAVGVDTEYTVDNFNSLLASKQLVLVLDGIDEVATETGKKLAASNAAEYFRGNRERTTLFFTGRNEGDCGKIESARILSLKISDSLFGESSSPSSEAITFICSRR